MTDDNDCRVTEVKQAIDDGAEVNAKNERGDTPWDVCGKSPVARDIGDIATAVKKARFQKLLLDNGTKF